MSSRTRIPSPVYLSADLIARSTKASSQSRIFEGSGLKIPDNLADTKYFHISGGSYIIHRLSTLERFVWSLKGSLSSPLLVAVEKQLRLSNADAADWKFYLKSDRRPYLHREINCGSWREIKEEALRGGESQRYWVKIVVHLQHTRVIKSKLESKASNEVADLKNRLPKETQDIDGLSHLRTRRDTGEAEGRGMNPMPPETRRLANTAGIPRCIVL